MPFFTESNTLGPKGASLVIDMFRSVRLPKGKYLSVAFSEIIILSSFALRDLLKITPNSFRVTKYFSALFSKRFILNEILSFL
jgi:hypothetical protein